MNNLFNLTEKVWPSAIPEPFEVDQVTRMIA
jgi:hypothetical protein